MTETAQNSLFKGWPLFFSSGSLLGDTKTQGDTENNGGIVRKIVFICLCLLVVTTIYGCTNMPKQNFIDQANILSGKPKHVTLPPAKKYDVNEKLDIFYRKLLKNPVIAGSIYDEAILENQAWSFDSILNSKWYIKLLKRGISRAKDEDKITLIQLLSNKFDSATSQECSLIKRDTMYLYPLYNAEEADEFFRLQFNAILAGTAKSNSNKIEVEKATYIAVLAFIAKAKETISDKELGEILYTIVQKQKTGSAIDCKIISKMLILINSIEPKYRNSLFEILEFL